MRKVERELRGIAREFDGHLRRRRGGHYAIDLPNGRSYTASASPSDRRDRQNMLTDLRRLAAQEGP